MFKQLIAAIIFTILTSPSSLYVSIIVLSLHYSGIVSSFMTLFSMSVSHIMLSSSSALNSSTKISDGLAAFTFSMSSRAFVTSSVVIFVTGLSILSASCVSSHSFSAFSSSIKYSAQRFYFLHCML